MTGGSQNAGMNPTGKLDRKLLAAGERLGRAVRVAKQQAANRHRLTPLQVDVVGLLAKGRGLRVGEIAAELDVTQPTVSDSINALVEKGFVGRDRDPNDRRASIVGLTESGDLLAHDLAAELAPLAAADPDTPDHAKAIALRVLLTEIRRLHLANVITVDRSCLTCRHYNHSTRPAHCLLLDRPLVDADLRVDCPEHQPA